MQVTIGGQSYTLLMEGSAFNGLQSIAFRKPYADNSTVGSSEVAKLDIYNWFKRLMALGGNTERQPEKMKNTIAKTGKQPNTRSGKFSRAFPSGRCCNRFR